MVRIPSEYQEVEYLESTGKEWIDGGVIPDQHLSFHCKFIVYNDVEPGYGNVFGSRLSNTVQEYQLSVFSLGIVSVGNRQANFGFYKNVINTVDFNGETTVTVNGVEKQRGVSDEVYNKSIFLFGIRNASNIVQIQPGRIYELSFGNVANFIPCYRKSDQEPGMYDTVRNQFFTNSGTGRFLVGNDVSHSNVNLMESRRRILLNTPHINSLSDNSLSFKSDMGYFYKDFKIHFGPVQDLHGYDHPWPAGGGKNLFNPQSAEKYWVTVDGSYTQFSNAKSVTLDAVAGETYTISSSNERTATNVICIAYYDENDNNLLRKIPAASGTYVTAKAPTNTAKMIACCYTYPEAGNVQLEKNSSATSYTPYSNICSISGRTSVEVVRCRKNLYDLNKQLFPPNNTNTVLIIDLPHNTDFVFSTDKTITGLYAQYSDDEEMPNAVYSQAWTNIKYIYSNTSLSFNSGEHKWYRLFTYEASGREERTFQLELGSTATPYEPYQGESYDIDFPQSAGTVYGGTIDLLAGTLTVDMAMVDLGELSWDKGPVSSETLDYSYFRATPSPQKAENFNFICSQYETANVNRTNVKNTQICVFNKNSSGWPQIVIRDDAYSESTVSEFATAMSGVQLAYELATPQTYQLTPETIRTLKGINNVFSNANGNIDVSFYSH